MICEQGAVGELFYVLIRGRVEVSVDGVVKAELRGCADRRCPPASPQLVSLRRQIPYADSLWQPASRCLPACPCGARPSLRGPVCMAG
eukprot:COSAG01_NODE_46785_length_397_cov_0.510067_1_plen_87_part_01